MSDQTVSLKLEGDATDLQRALNESGQAMEDLSGKAESAAGDIEASVSGASSAWEDHQGAINATAGVLAAAGAAAEGFARSQADSNQVLARTSIATGEATDELRDMAFAMSDHTFAAADAAVGMEMLVQKGFDTREEFERILPTVDDLADAVGKDFPDALNSADRLLAPFGQTLADLGDESDHLARMIAQTDVPLGTLERNLGRVPDELQALEFGMHEAAAGIEVFRDRGFSGQESVREFRRAVADSGGDFGQFLDTLNLSADGWNDYLAAAEPAPGLTRDLADANNAAATPLQNLTQHLENLAFKYGDLAEAAGMLSPIIMGGGGMLFAVNQAVSAKQALAASGGSAATALGRLGRAVGPAAAITVGLVALHGIVGKVDEALHGLPTSVDDLQLALQGLADIGNEPDVVAGSIDGLAESFEFLMTGHGGIGAIQNWVNTLSWMPDVFQSPSWRNARDEIANFDEAMAGLAASGDAEQVAIGLEIMQAMADEAGMTLDELIREHFPNYERAAERAALASQDGASASGEYGAALDAQKGSQDEATSAAERHAEAVDELLGIQRAAVDPVFALERAMQRYDDVSNDAEATSWDVARAIAELERAALDGDLSFGEFERQLDRWVDAGRISQTEANNLRSDVADLRGEAEMWAGTYEAEFRMRMDVSQADINMAERWTAAAEAATRAASGARSSGASSSPSTSGSGTAPRSIPQTFEARADGGPVWPGDWFLVGEEGPELAQFTSTAQVYSAPETAQMLSTTGSSREGTRVEVTQNFQQTPSHRDLWRARDMVRGLADDVA